MTRLVVFAFAAALIVNCARVDSADKRPENHTASGSQWPQWRGPNRDGISNDTGLLTAWPKGGPTLLWKIGGLGRGFSSLAVAGNRIYTMGDREDGEFVLAFNLADGKPLWSRRISDVWEPQGYAGPRCSPTVDRNRVYVIGPHGDLVCLNADSGEEMWHRNLKTDFAGQMHSGWGYSESPLVDGERIVCTPGGPQAGIVALDKTSGSELWRAAIPPIGDLGGDGAAYSSIVIGQGAGVRQYVQLMGRGVVGVSAADGKFLWGYNRVANRTANIPTPVVHGDYVFCSTGYQAGAALLELKRDGGGVKAHEVYFLEGKEFQNHHGGMILLGDYVYAGHGHNAGAPTCLEWKTGKTVWRHNRGPGTGSAAISYADGNLYFRFQDGVMALIEATPEEYREKGQFSIPGVEQPSWSHPVIAGGKLYLREQDTLFCYDMKK
ncbi:MAG TPA: PQQ-binding-like beta-propeller repeat protein [Pirellulales bacterium]|jgi:outer membrane protein assembly factor BamB|nr:PQQ-binding-like beta-propeller repeat protein [Pirellulales bacterium]